MEPTVFGTYTLLRRIAMGGTAEIFLARRHGVDGFARHLAIKRILPHLADNEDFIQLILDEARLAAHLHHGHIVQIHEVGVEDEQAYIAMEYLPGTDLGRLLRAAGKRQRRVLIIHQDAEARSALAEALGALDVRVCVAGTTEEATLRSAEGAVDLVVIEADVVGPIRDPLLRELQSRHPELLRVIILGQTEGRGHGCYAVTTAATRPEQVRRLARRCLQPRIPLEIAVQLIRAVTGGLDHAHTAVDYNNEPLKIVHRDVNPSNVLLSTTGSIKLVDFGIARATTTVRAQDNGSFVGTYHYMSPEQARGKPADARSDLFSLSTMIYELATGTNPYRGDNEFATMRAIREDTPRVLSELVPGIPSALGDIAIRAGQKEVEQRYAKAEDLLGDIEDFIRRESIYLSPKRLAGFMKVIYGEDELAEFSVSGTGISVTATAQMAAIALQNSRMPAAAEPEPEPKAPKSAPPPEIDVDLNDFEFDQEDALIEGTAMEPPNLGPTHPIDAGLRSTDPLPPEPSSFGASDGMMKLILTLLIVALVAVAGWYWHWRSSQSIDSDEISMSTLAVPPASH